MTKERGTQNSCSPSERGSHQGLAAESRCQSSSRQRQSKYPHQGEVDRASFASLVMNRGRTSSNAGSAPGAEAPPWAALIESLRTLGVAKPPQQKWLHVRVGHASKERRLTWYDPCEPAALDAMLRAACSVPVSQPYLLLESATMSAVAVSSSMPSGGSFELVRNATGQFCAHASHHACRAQTVAYCVMLTPLASATCAGGDSSAT